MADSPHDDRAARLVHEVMRVGQSHDISLLSFQGHHLLGSLARSRGDLQQALSEYDLSIRELERLRGRLHDTIEAAGRSNRQPPRITYWQEFLADYHGLLLRND